MAHDRFIGQLSATDPDAGYGFPPPRFEVDVDRDVMVVVRDGIRLASTIHRPRGADGRLPTILIRTQYDRDREAVAADFAGQGFAVVVQDVRGLGGSDGPFTLGGHDAEDGYDTLSWIAGQPWSNGRVGTFGCSSLGINQVLLAALRHPAHTCAIAQASGGASRRAGNRYSYWDVRRGGAVEIGWSIGWFIADGTKDGTHHEHPSKDACDEATRSLPVIDMVRRLSPGPTDWEDYVSREPADPWWDQFGFLDDDTVTDVPTLFMTSWYDVGVGEVLDQRRVFEAHAASERARTNQYALIAPTKHCGYHKARADYTLADRYLGDARFDYPGMYLRWFDAWLNGDGPGPAPGELPAVRYFHLGRNEWRTSGAWPVPESVETAFHLVSQGGANSRLGDGVLSTTPAAGAPSDSFTYDPADPVPSRGGGAGGSHTLVGPRDQSDIELRSDVLCYTSEPFDEPLDVTGPVQAVLYVSSDVLDTDLTAKLVDVGLDGRAIDLCEAFLRLRYRDGYEQPRLMTPGEVYEVRLDLQATSTSFDIGHRIRLEVSSSNFPRFDRNLNTGGTNYDETSWVVARTTIHHTAAEPSRLILWVVPPLLP